MSEASFKKHLEELKAVLNQLQGDIESGPDDVVEDWYQQTKEVIYNYEDEVDSNLYVRLGMDEDSIVDGDILVDEDTEEADITEETENEDVQIYEEDSEDNTEQLDDSEDEVDYLDSDITEIDATANPKTITINITLPKS